jgi:hypothetical protein
MRAKICPVREITNFAGLIGESDAWNDDIAVDGDQLAVGVGVEGAGACVLGFTIRGLNLEPATPDQRQVKLVRGADEATLDVEVSHGRGLHAEPDMRPLGNDGLVGRIGNALIALDLVEQIGEFGAGTLETRWC